MAQDSITDTLAAALLDIAHGMPEIHDARLAADGTTVDVTVTPGTEATRIPLARLTKRLLATPPGGRPAELRTLLDSIVETVAVTTEPEDRDTALLLALRTMVFAAGQANTGPPTIAAEIVPGVADVLVLDRPTTTVHVTSTDLDRWGITADEAFHAARDNLAQAPEPGGWERTPGAKLWQLTRPDLYAASRAFTPGWLIRNSPPGLGPLFVAVPTRELVFAGRVREVGSDLARIAELVRHAWKSSHDRVSPVLYGFDSTGAARPLTVKGDKHATRALRNSELSHLMTAYARQHKNFAASAPSGDHWQELGVANLVGREVTATEWTGTSIGDLLPRAEFVMIPPITDNVVVPWDVVLRVAGDHVQPEPGAIPQRWRTVRELTSAQLAELAGHTAARPPR